MVTGKVIKSRILNYQRNEQVCIVCGNYCNTLNIQKVYCCLDLPPKFVTLPVGSWICKMCAERVLMT